MHVVLEAHDRAASLAETGGFFIDWIDQRDPFHTSARVCCTNETPTAVQARGDVHDTASNWLSG